MVSISIIIPSYNTPKEYLLTCIDSILKQSFQDYEIIIVDDGSDQEYAEVINEIALFDKRICAFHQVNKGVSAARNFGVSQAAGKYIMFVDSDDQIIHNCLENAYYEAEKTKADIVYGLEYISTGETDIAVDNQYNTAYIIGDEWLRKHHIGFLFKRDGLILGRGPYSRIIRADIVKNTPFPEGVPIGEDVLWNLDIINRTHSKYIVYEAWYNYINRTESITHRYNENIMSQLIPFYRLLPFKLQDTDKDQFLFSQRVLRDLKRYIYDNYLGNKLETESFIKKWIKFNRVCKKYPWTVISKKWLALYGDKHTKRMRFLFKIQMLFPFWKYQAAYKKRGI